MAEQNEMIDILNDKQKVLTEDWTQYWQQFSSYDTWQFWLQIIFFITPLVVL
ncbi:hypothetical protein ACQCVP_21865 [Rossellomorea vietnamensis]|uniref:hypothetical protein n=1 Tax=Rossellomorea vietnamensis TaxID=218284 RepID=UPI003CEB2B39